MNAYVCVSIYLSTYMCVCAHVCARVCAFYGEYFCIEVAVVLRFRKPESLSHQEVKSFCEFRPFHRGETRDARGPPPDLGKKRSRPRAEALLSKTLRLCAQWFSSPLMVLFAVLPTPLISFKPDVVACILSSFWLFYPSYAAPENVWNVVLTNDLTVGFIGLCVTHHLLFPGRSTNSMHFLFCLGKCSRYSLRRELSDS